MKIKQLLEAVEKEVKEGRNFTKILRAPFDKTDYNELLKLSSSGIRFIADATTKKVFMFSGDLMHYRACAEIGIPYTQGSPLKITPIIFGVGYWNPDKKILQFEESFNLSETENFAESMKDWRRAFYRIADANWEFTKPYISGMIEAISKLKNKIKKIEERQ